jgi:hypothetical protein
MSSAQRLLTPVNNSTVLKERIIAFVKGASTEIAPTEEKYLPQLVELLPQGSAVYISSPASTTLPEVIRTALAVQRAGFRATPHIVARRLNYPHTLRIALAQLCAGGIEQIMLVRAMRLAQAANLMIRWMFSILVISR